MNVEFITKTAVQIQAIFPEPIDFGIILGSGLGSIANSVTKGIHIPYEEIPGWPVTSVLGHKGELVLGKIDTKNVLIMNGRIHYYEGYNMQEITLPIRVMQKMGLKNIIITNAAGAVNPAFDPGDIMMINDHLNIMGMAGENPLRGKNIDQFGPRFPDMSQAYDRDMMKIARQVSEKVQIELREGVYAGLSGPSFESPAELRFLKAIGVDAVGMSTVPEVIIARHGDMSVLGLSGISNKANLDGTTITTHKEVLEASELIAPKMEKIIKGFISQYQQMQC